jgi:hypothetical protein
MKKHFSKERTSSPAPEGGEPSRLLIGGGERLRRNGPRRRSRRSAIQVTAFRAKKRRKFEHGASLNVAQCPPTGFK